MGRCIIKLTDDAGVDFYAEYSTVVDAPTTYGLRLDEFKAFIKEQEGARGLAELPERLARCDKQGTSFQMEGDLLSLLACNRAGKGETTLTYRQIVATYCHREPKPKGHACGKKCERDGCNFEVDDRVLVDHVADHENAKT